MALDTRFFKTSVTGRPVEFGAIFAPATEWLGHQEPEEIVDPDIPIVDAHHHLWRRLGFPYEIEDFVTDLESGHNVIGTVFVDCGSGYRTTGPEEFKPVGETEHIVDTTRGQARVAAAIIGFADLELGAGVEAVLEQHLAAGGGRFRGIRYSTGWNDSSEIENTQAAKRPNMLREAKIRDGARKLAKLGLTLDVWLFHTQLDDVIDLADAVPELRIVLDHCGGPLGYGPYATDREAHFAEWRRSIIELSQRPNVVCKIGGLLARGAAFDYLHAAVPPTSGELAATWRPWFDVCVDAFGPRRCMFESNFPVEKMGTGYAVLWNAYKKLARSGSDSEQRALLSDTACRTYFLDSAQSFPRSQTGVL